MRYQLILRFEGDTLEDFEQMVALESELGERAGELAVFDGHAMGSDEANISVLTTDPLGAFRRMSEVLDRRQLLEAVVAAYRPVGGKDFTVIWPEEPAKDSTVA